MESRMEYIRQNELNLFNFRNLTLSTCFAFITACAIIFLKYALRRSIYSVVVPSRKQKIWNLWGNIDDFYYSARIRHLSSNVYMLQVANGYNQLFKQEKFFYFWLCYTPLLLVTKAQAVEEIIAGSRNMEKAWFYNWLHPWLGTGLLTSHGSKWKSRRKLLTPAFHFDILKDFLPVLNEQSQLLVNLLKKETTQSWTDIVKPITLCSLDIICETTLGVSIGAQVNSQSEYVQAVHRASEGTSQRVLHPAYWTDWIFNFTQAGKKLNKDIKLLHDFTRSIISDKKQKILLHGNDQKRKRKALMDLLLEHHIETHTLTEEDIREEVDTFTFEGHDTTSVGMTWALYLIGLHKDVQENIHEELDMIFGEDFERTVTTEDLKNMEYLERVLKESQRLYPSVPFFARQLNEEINISGTKIPKNIGCLIAAYCLHRDESVFPNPEKFDPDRFLPENSLNRHPYAYIPFSAGPRNCIGQRFAMMEEKVVIANILRNYTLESLDPRDKVLPASELILRSSVPVRIKIRSRRPQA